MQIMRSSLSNATLKQKNSGYYCFGRYRAALLAGPNSQSAEIGTGQLFLIAVLSGGVDRRAAYVHRVIKRRKADSVTTLDRIAGGLHERPQ